MRRSIKRSINSKDVKQLTEVGTQVRLKGQPRLIVDFTNSPHVSAKAIEYVFHFFLVSHFIVKLDETLLSFRLTTSILSWYSHAAIQV